MPQRSIDSPIGPIRLLGDGTLLTAIRIGAAPDREEDAADPLLAEAAAQLHAYLDGRLAQFALPLAAAASPRGTALRDAIVAIPRGATASYGMLARASGSGPRAIGQACARNRFPIVVPCHRVVAGGGIGNYSAGDGIATKRWLLDHEAKGDLWAR